VCFDVYTHEIIPNKWYSLTGPRDILANKPCCIPRSNRKIATLDDGCGTKLTYNLAGGEVLTISISTFTLRTVNHGMMILSRKVSSGLRWIYRLPCSQNCHTETEPEILLSNDSDTVWIPCMLVSVVTVSKDHENPGCVRRKFVKPQRQCVIQHLLEQRPTLSSGVNKLVVKEFETILTIQ